jgi:putative membrane-bound dehydrogenase-like protein
MIHKPIAMAFDHKGRLWVSETVDYPNEKNPQGKGRDRISIIEDRDGDGTAETSTVFAEDLSIPTSFCFARGGVIVTQAPEILFLKDTNGDDRADVREVLFRGFDTSDTHAGPSNLRYGLDGWIYGIIGYAGFSGTVNGERISFRQGFFRFLPDGSKIEFLRSTNNNSWGVGISEEGLLFGSTANGCPSVFMPIANRYFESVRGWSPSVLRMISDTYRFFPITEKVRQVDWHGGFTAGAGHALYTARVFPEAYWNRTAFVAEPTGHLVATFTLHPSGADFVSHYGWKQMASDDEWTAPIAAEVGPDGCVWVIDWYNIVVQHNPTPKGFKTGKGNAYETDLRDKTHGRIYRIVPTGAEIAKQAALDPKQPDELLNALGSQNMFWRMHAQRLLVERGDRDVVPKLLKLAADAAVEEPLGLNAKATHALWALRGLGAIEGPNAIPEARAAALAALSHQAAGVRRNAIAVAPRDEAATVAVLKSGALRDSEPQVRLAALLALADSPESAAAAEALVDRLVGEEIVLDPVLAQGYTTAAARHAESFLVAAGRAKWARVVAPETIELMTRVAEHHARGTGPMDRILVALASADRRIARAVVGGLDRGWPQNRAVALSGEARAAFDRILESTTESGDSQASLLSLSRKLGVEGIEAAIERVVTALVAELDDESKLDATRVATARRFMMFDPNAAQKILSRITPKTSPALAAGWIEAMGSSNQPEVGVALVQALPKLLPEARAAAIKLLVERAAWTRSLLDGIDSGAVRLDQLALDQRQALLANRDKALADRAQKLMARGGSLPDPDRQAVIEKLGPLLAQGGDAEKGKALFTQHCAKCHRHSGEGGNVGPDLTGMAAHPREELIIHLLDPSRSVEGTFVTYNVATLDGRLLSGLLAAESRTSIELVDAEGKRQTVLREDIDELTATKKSLMPEGFEKQVSTDELRDVLAFLTKRGKYLPLDLAKVATTISTKGMFYDETADVERLVFTDWSPKTVDGVPFVLIDPQGARVRNAVVLRSPSGLLTRGLPRSIELPCHSPAKAIHILGGVGGWAHPYGDGKTVSMIVRLHYKDGATEDHELLNGVHIADYIRVVDVPESKLAFRLRGQQIRSLTITPKREDEIERLELVKGPDDTAPVVMAVTVETR